jgi:hypothetical protein
MTSIERVRALIEAVEYLVPTKYPEISWSVEYGGVGVLWQLWKPSGGSAEPIDTFGYSIRSLE